VRRAAALALLAAGCKLLLGDPDRIIALEIVGPVTYTVPVDDTLHLAARARSANGDTVIGAAIVWAVLDTLPVGIALDTAAGIVIALTPGDWRVQARVEEIRSDPIVITVTAAAAAVPSVPAPSVPSSADGDSGRGRCRYAP